MIDKIKLSNFTLFNEALVDLSPKINVIIGCNGTGKTHLLKSAYAAYGHGVNKANSASGADSTRREIKEEISASVTERLVSCFMPHEEKLGKIHRHGATEKAELELLLAHDAALSFSFSNRSKKVGADAIATDLPRPVFIPTKEVLSFSKGFSSLYQNFQLSFDSTYFDICSLLDLPEQRPGSLHEKAKWAIDEIERICGGRFVFYGGGNVTFRNAVAEYSANAVAEGFRKAGMLSRLLEVGAIQPGVSGPLFWDEPETNLNPRLMGKLVEILLELSRNGQQIILATHEYVMLKWFDLHASGAKEDEVVYHSLHETEDGGVEVQSTSEFLHIEPNPIADTFEELTRAQLRKQISGDVS